MRRGCRRYRYNFIDRQIRKFDDMHDYAWCTNFFSFFICLFLGFSIRAIAQQPLNQTLIRFGDMYLFCAVCSLCIFGVCLVFDN